MIPNSTRRIPIPLLRQYFAARAERYLEGRRAVSDAAYETLAERIVNEDLFMMSAQVDKK